jgi:hypothetical protein
LSSSIAHSVPVAPEPAKPDALNRPLIEQIITQITTEPERHSQNSFGHTSECGTVHCVAGWAVVLSHQATPRWNPLGQLNMCVMADGRILPVWIAASQLLGITQHEATCFQGDECREADCDNPSLFYDFGDTEHMVGRLKDLLNEGGCGVSMESTYDGLTAEQAWQVKEAWRNDAERAHTDLATIEAVLPAGTVDPQQPVGPQIASYIREVQRSLSVAGDHAAHLARENQQLRQDRELAGSNPLAFREG